jgi:hypothetical protein
VFWPWDRGRGWQSREINLKELKHEGHIALRKWNSQWSHMQPYVGWALLLASVTCLQGYIRWDSFVLGAQPLDMSPLDLWWHNKKLLPAKLPQRLLAHNFPQHWDCRLGYHAQWRFCKTLKSIIIHSVCVSERETERERQRERENEENKSLCP